MNRRRFIASASAGSTAGIGGCIRRLRPKKRLWFVQVENQGLETVDLALSVYRSGTEVFSQTYSDIVSFRENEYDEASFARGGYLRFAKGWDPEPGRYTVQYTYRGETVKTPVSEIEGTGRKNLGLTLILSPGRTLNRPSFDSWEFDSPEGPQTVIDQVEREMESEE